MLHRAECWAMKKPEEAQVHVAEMHMLRRVCRVTRHDRIKKSIIEQIYILVKLKKNQRVSYRDGLGTFRKG